MPQNYAPNRYEPTAGTGTGTAPVNRYGAPTASPYAPESRLNPWGYETGPNGVPYQSRPDLQMSVPVGGSPRGYAGVAPATTGTGGSTIGPSWNPDYAPGALPFYPPFTPAPMGYVTPGSTSRYGG